MIPLKTDGASVSRNALAQKQNPLCCGSERHAQTKFELFTLIQKKTTQHGKEIKQTNKNKNPAKMKCLKIWKHYC